MFALLQIAQFPPPQNIYGKPLPLDLWIVNILGKVANIFGPGKLIFWLLRNALSQTVSLNGCKCSSTLLIRAKAEKSNMSGTIKVKLRAWVR